jgi:hypothetical protein
MMYLGQGFDPDRNLLDDIMKGRLAIYQNYDLAKVDDLL